MLIYCLFLLVACCNLNVASGFNATEADKVNLEQECSCGPHGNCSYEEGVKTCICILGFAELDGNCEVCRCSESRDSKCHFLKGLKECLCAEGYFDKHGLCQEIPLPSIEVRYSYETYIVFRFHLTNVAAELEKEPFIITLENRDVKSSSTRYDHHNQPKSEVSFVDERIDLNPSITYEYRYSIQILDINRTSLWTTWKQYETKDPRVPDAPVIIEPRNGSHHLPGRNEVIWAVNGRDVIDRNILQTKQWWFTANGSGWDFKHSISMVDEGGSSWYYQPMYLQAYRGLTSIGIVVCNEVGVSEEAVVFIHVGNSTCSKNGDCENGGTCNGEVPKFCKCPQGTGGTFCEVIDWCISNKNCFRTGGQCEYDPAKESGFCKCINGQIYDNTTGACKMVDDHPKMDQRPPINVIVGSVIGSVLVIIIISVSFYIYLRKN